MYGGGFLIKIFMDCRWEPFKLVGQTTAMQDTHKSWCEHLCSSLLCWGTLKICARYLQIRHFCSWSAYIAIWYTETELFTSMFFAQVNPDHPGQDVRWTRRASGASQTRAPPSRMRHAKPSHKFGFTLPLMEEQRLFHTIRWSDQQARSALAVKINRQPCPSLSGQQLLPQPGSEVMPILPSGPHEAQSLMHIIREQPSQKFFSTEIFLYLLSLSNFLWYLLSGHSLPAHPSRTPPSPRGFQGVFFFFF